MLAVLSDFDFRTKVTVRRAKKDNFGIERTFVQWISVYNLNTVNDGFEWVCGYGCAVSEWLVALQK